eukprot:2715034-Pyramimonas_sp.AAC.2
MLHGVWERSLKRLGCVHLAGTRRARRFHISVWIVLWVAFGEAGPPALGNLLPSPSERLARRRLGVATLGVARGRFGAALSCREHCLRQFGAVSGIHGGLWVRAWVSSLLVLKARMVWFL